MKNQPTKLERNQDRPSAYTRLLERREEEERERQRVAEYRRRERERSAETRAYLEKFRGWADELQAESLRESMALKTSA